MTNNRRSSIKRSNKEIKGKGICRFCKSLVSAPRRTFCSDSCVHEWKIRSNTKYLRQFIYDRDLGICELCKIDTRYIRIEIENRRRQSSIQNDNSEYLIFLKSLNVTEKEAFRSLWHADHILPVSQGGGESGLDNFRTLCIKCHKLETRKLKRHDLK